MDAINKLVDVIVKQNEFILKLMNDDRVTQEIKLEYAEKYNKLRYSEKDFDNYKYPCDFLLRITADVYTNEYIVVINELSEILGKIGDALNKED